MTLSRSVRKPRSRRNIWFERLMAVVALVNLGLLSFDLSYISFRDFYLKRFPEFTRFYGEQFKGIEPHRETAAYLEAVNQLEDLIVNNPIDSDVVREQLATLRTLSDEMIDTNPFEVADKSGTLERIKNEMRDRMNIESSKDAFARFWSVDYLSEDPPGEPQTRWPEAIAFYNEEIEPLLETNYYRGLGEDGNPLDRFWLIDRWFIGILALEFAMRTVYLSRRYKGVNWIDAIVWRWYDLMFFLPFWRWLRVIPVTIRLGQAKLVNLAIVGNRIRRAIVTHFAIELTEIVVIRVIDQVQNLVIRGEVRQFLLSSSSSRRYIDINGVDEIEVITKRVTDIIVGQVLPKIKPDIDAFLSHNVNMVLQGSPMYRGLGNLPNFEQGSNQLVNGMVGQLSQSIYDAIQSALEDEKGAELTRKIIASFVQVSRKEALSQRQTVEEIESLMNDLLEEVKINYVKRLSEEDVEELQQEAQEQVYELVEN
jgi:hypothetical protein